MPRNKDNGEGKIFSVSIVIPVFNEELTVGNIVNRTRKTLEKMGIIYEILVVDDGSTDCSSIVSKDMGARVLKVTHQGKGYALRCGFNQAKGDLIITLDADGSHQPEQIPLLVQKINEKEADFIIGSRFLNSKSNKEKVPKINRIGNRLFNNLIGFLLGLKVSDSQSGFRAMNTLLIKKMKLNSFGYEVESEMLIKALRLGAKVMEIPIHFDQRTIGTSKLDPLLDGLRILYAILRSYLR